MISGEQSWAQNAAPTLPDDPVSSTTRAKNANQFPPFPAAFARGNVDASGSGTAGYYLSMWKFVPIVLLFFGWVWTSKWAYDDGQQLKVRPIFWSSVILGSGIFGLLLALNAKMFLIAMFFGLAGCGIPLGIYIKERNDQVPDSAKILTERHLRKLATRYLAKIGIHIGTREAVDKAVGPPIRFIGKSASGGEKNAPDRSRQVESSKGYLAAKELVYDAILRRATDVHLEPKEDELSIRLRIDGVMYPTEPFDRGTGDAVVNIFKVISSMDITERRRPQDGSFRAEMDLREIDFRVATQGTRFGEKMSLRILDQSSSVSKLSHLGLRPQVLERLKGVIDQPHGLFLACGPTGAGKSTTLYAALHEMDCYENNIITVEDPIEYKMEGVTQIEINSKTGQSFGTALRSILRQDPDVVMIGEIRDQETAVIACQASTTGHMVFSTLHANDTFTALFRMIDLGVEPFMLSSSVSAIMGQRLTRKLCADCREAYKPNPELLKQANLPVDKIDKFFRPPKDAAEPCPTCGGLGYKGRVGVYEFLEINERLREMVREKDSMNNMKSEARKNGFLYMKEEGLRLVVKGITSIDEMLRVVK
jgi:type II secretory ATPase GspE/PulE/Tfp pilus assembly ATPase PilB-like protein